MVAFVVSGSLPVPDGYLPPNEPNFTDRPRGDYDLGRISDGLCPVFVHSQLRLSTELPYAGWCDACGLGWSMDSGVPTAHLRPAGMRVEVDDGRRR